MNDDGGKAAGGAAGKDGDVLLDVTKQNYLKMLEHLRDCMEENNWGECV
jgi:hypothetical protein